VRDVSTLPQYGVASIFSEYNCSLKLRQACATSEFTAVEQLFRLRIAYEFLTSPSGADWRPSGLGLLPPPRSSYDAGGKKETEEHVALLKRCYGRLRPDRDGVSIPKTPSSQAQTRWAISESSC